MNRYIVFLLFGCIVVQAQDMMRIKMKDGNHQVIPIEAIQKITFTGVTDVDAQTQHTISTVLKTFTLLQNYPNPFNPATTITYSIPKPNIVTVRIVDISGKIVVTLADEFQNEGEHRLQWNGRNSSGQHVSSGMYMYEVRYDGIVTARKMMLIK